jgi:hypothetical protein
MMSVSRTLQYNLKSLMNELERMLKESAVASVEASPRNLPGDTEKPHQKSSQNDRYPGPDFNRRPPKHEAVVLTKQP